MNEKFITLREVIKEYKQGPNIMKALNGVNLAIDNGIMVAIVGPSGSGKTTLLNIIGALDRPTSGEVYIDGINLSNLNEQELTIYRRQKVGFVFQDYGLIPNLNALENVMLPMEFARLTGREERAKELLKTVAMEHRAAHTPAKLSGGEQQRVAIARALANDPQIILADEPTGNLDTKTGEEIVNLLKELVNKRDKTLLIVTHDTAITQIADLHYYIQDGKITKNLAGTN